MVRVCDSRLRLVGRVSDAAGVSAPDSALAGSAPRARHGVGESPLETLTLARTVRHEPPVEHATGDSSSPLTVAAEIAVVVYLLLFVTGWLEPIAAWLSRGLR